MALAMSFPVAVAYLDHICLAFPLHFWVQRTDMSIHKLESTLTWLGGLAQVLALSRYNKLPRSTQCMPPYFHCKREVFQHRRIVSGYGQTAPVCLYSRKACVHEQWEQFVGPARNGSGMCSVVLPGAETARGAWRGQDTLWQPAWLCPSSTAVFSLFGSAREISGWSQKGGREE